jgi:phosphoribosyl-AMP cyclohydrolase / phosphoribosyl-ATP pyrophosphohydrolase
MVELRFDEQGLIPAIAQDRFSGQVRMVAWMSREALERTLVTGRATFFSRSRKALWEKGETSGNGLQIESIWADCDGDTLLLLVEPEGPSCHTGRATCFFRRVTLDAITTEPREAEPELQRLEGTIAERSESSPDKSYTRRLLDGGPSAIGEKLREEGAELAAALDLESAERVANEAADVLYHLLAGLHSRQVPLSAVLSVLASRSGRSGLEERAARGVEKP